MSRPQRLATLLRLSLIADALVLPAHWIYDPPAIQQRFGILDTLQAPPSDGYHAGQPAGGQTHYGTQALALLESLEDRHTFDAAHFLARWTGLWQSDGHYRDKATRTTLEALAAGQPPTAAGSSSDDLGGVARMAPLLVALDSAGDEAVEAAAVRQTEMTHRDPVLLETAVFLTRAVREVLDGASVADALEVAAARDYQVLPAADYLTAAKSAVGRRAIDAVGQLGAACPVTGALPATLALALMYPGDPETALVENAMAGGDSAARGLVLGMLLGAADGATIPERWRQAWQAGPRVDAFLAAQGIS